MVLTFAMGGYAVLAVTVIPTFQQLEQKAAAVDMERARSGIQRALDSLSHLTEDWSQWDEMYAWLGGHSPDFLRDNIHSDSLWSMGVNLAVIYDPAGRMHWGTFVDPRSGEGTALSESPLDPSLVTRLQAHRGLLDDAGNLLATDHGLMLGAARPIVKSDGTGPELGILVFARQLNPDNLGVLRDLAQVALDIQPLAVGHEGNLTPINPTLFGATEVSVSDTQRLGRQVLHTVTGAPVAMLLVESARAISELTRDTLRALGVLMAILTALVAVGLWLVLNRLVVSPITELKAQMASIEKDGELTETIHWQRDDELGSLARAFSSMLAELREIRRRHIDQSFKAGQAEMAAGVLHNVRNSLMPVLNHVAVAEEELSQSVGEYVQQAQAELLADDLGAERRSKLVEYLKSAHRNSAEAMEEVDQQLKDAARQLNTVLEILKHQEQFEHAAPVFENINVGELLQEAVKVIPADSDSGIKIRLARNLDQFTIHGHRVGLLQVFNNLVLNAFEAIKDSCNHGGVISLNAAPVDDDGQSMIQVRVKDSGPGIEPEDLGQVFERGYTGKDRGNRGLGLHWSANAVQSMGARIRALSEGPGMGAEFVVEIRRGVAQGVQ